LPLTTSEKYVIKRPKRMRNCDLLLGKDSQKRKCRTKRQNLNAMLYRKWGGGGVWVFGGVERRRVARNMFHFELESPVKKNSRRTKQLRALQLPHGKKYVREKTPKEISAPVPNTNI